MNPNGLWSRPRFTAPATTPANFTDGSTAKLGAAYDQRIFPQSSLFEILDQRGERLIGVLGVDLVRENIPVRIPGVAFGVVHLRHSDALFRQASRRKNAASHRSGPV